MLPARLAVGSQPCEQRVASRDQQVAVGQGYQTHNVVNPRLQHTALAETAASQAITGRPLPIQDSPAANNVWPSYAQATLERSPLSISMPSTSGRPRNSSVWPSRTQTFTMSA